MRQTFRDQTPIRLNVIIGVTVILGAIGGFYYLTRNFDFLSQILNRRSKKSQRDLCNVCFATLDKENFKICVSCCNCKKFVCRGQTCSTWIPSQAEWECRLCYLSDESRSKTSEWVNRHDPTKFAQSMKTLRNELSPSRGFDEDSNSVNNLEAHRQSTYLFIPEEREKIRGYVEDAISKILGGSLDDVSVGQLYNNSEYLSQNEQNRNDYAGVSNINLKRLVEQIIEETLNLPALLDHNASISGSRHDEHLPYFDPKKYQELLATAVLNKIVDTYSYEKKFDNSSDVQSIASNLDKNYNPTTTKNIQSCSLSSSSIEPQSDCSLTDPANDFIQCHDISPSDSCSNICSNAINQNDDESVLNEYVKRHKVPFPAFSMSSESADDEFLSITTSNGQDSTWEDNWLFKRKKLGADTSVGMLVPAPREDIKALIGDKTADEMSDLSEAGSDFEDSNNNMDSLDPQDVRIHNQNVISRKNNIGLFDELIEQTSLISTSSLPENEPIFLETRNDFVLGNDGFSDTENPKLHLSGKNTIEIENEAVNTNVTDKIVHQTSLGSFEEPIIAPPNDFTDQQVLSMQSSTVQSEDNKMNSLSSVGSDSSNTDRTSSDSNTTEDSTPTVIDVNEVNDQILDVNQNTCPASTSPCVCVTTNTSSTNQTNTITLSSATCICCDTNNINNSNYIRQDIKTVNPEMSTLSESLSEDDYIDEHITHLLPGSIAERERKKWLNAVEMPNNPYSPEALKRRLSDGPEKHIDIPNIVTNDDRKLPSCSNTNKSLDVGLEAEKSNYKRYSRDYYINADQISSENINKRNISSQYNESNNNNNNCSERSIHPGNEGTIIQSANCANDDKISENSDIYVAKLAHVEEDDNVDIIALNQQPSNILVEEEESSSQHHTKKESKIEEENESEISISSPTALYEQYSQQNTDSLTPSEDSDTIRIYDLTKQETRIIKEDKPTEIKSQNTSEIKTRPTILSVTTKLLPPKKIVTPAALKFLQPKRKIFEPEQIMSDIAGTSSPIFERRDITTPPVTQATVKVTEKNVIEPEVASALPSVKALAKAFLLSAKCSTKHSDNSKMTSHERQNRVNSITTPTTAENSLNNNNNEKTRPSPDSYSPPYQQVTYNVIGTLIKQNDITNDNGELAAGDNQTNQRNVPVNLDDSNDNKDKDRDYTPTVEVVSQERPMSPVLEPGKLKDNIAFFENLKKN